MVLTIQGTCSSGPASCRTTSRALTRTRRQPELPTMVPTLQTWATLHPLVTEARLVSSTALPVRYNSIRTTNCWCWCHVPVGSSWPTFMFCICLIHFTHVAYFTVSQTGFPRDRASTDEVYILKEAILYWEYGKTIYVLSVDISAKLTVC